MVWTTKLSEVVPEVLESYGAGEIYVAYFVPFGYGGKGPAISLGLPECELIMGSIGKNGEPVVMVNRPKINRNAKQWIKTACDMTREIEQAVVSFNCDTPEQLAHAVKLASRWLPGYERASLERMAKPEARAKGGLS